MFSLTMPWTANFVIFGVALNFTFLGLAAVLATMAWFAWPVLSAEARIEMPGILQRPDSTRTFCSYTSVASRLADRVVWVGPAQQGAGQGWAWSSHQSDLSKTISSVAGLHIWALRMMPLGVRSKPWERTEPC